MPCNRRKVRAGRPRDRQPLVSGQAKTNRQRALTPEDLPHLVSLDGVEIFVGSPAKRSARGSAHRLPLGSCRKTGCSSENGFAVQKP